MAALTKHQFSQWLEMYGKASKENDPRTSAELFAQNAKYYETPFDEPMIGRDAIYKYWSEVTQTLKDKTSSYEVLAVKDNLGIARWQSEFTKHQNWQTRCIGLPVPERAWQTMQSELAALSTNGKQVIAEQSGHFIQLQQPQLVIDAIREIVQATHQ